MKKTPLERALHYLSRRKFTDCLLALEPALDLYRDNFNYYLVGGIACLYLDDFGSANIYFQKARQFSQTNPTLLLGQAVLFLRHGDMDRAVQYYLDVLEQEPNNRVAKRGMTFIREKGNYEEIYRLNISKGLRKFYPSLGVNPAIFSGIISAILIGITAFAVFFLLSHRSPHEIRFFNSGNGLEADDFYLSTDDLKNIIETDSESLSSYFLTEKEIEKLYKNAYKHATESVDGNDNLHRTNLAHSEANKILNSNASKTVKVKAQEIIDVIEADREHEPTFGTLLDNFSCDEVLKNPLMYDGCWVIWTGMLANAKTENGVSKCKFLVWDENMEHHFGSFDLIFTSVPTTPISGDRIIQVLAKVKLEEGLNGKKVITLIEKADSMMLRNQEKVQSLNQK